MSSIRRLPIEIETAPLAYAEEGRRSWRAGDLAAAEASFLAGKVLRSSIHYDNLPAWEGETVLTTTIRATAPTRSAVSAPPGELGGRPAAHVPSAARPAAPPPAPQARPTAPTRPAPTDPAPRN